MDFRVALIEETKAFGELYRDADPATPIPTCPGWSLQQLFKHLGRGNRWCAQIVSERRTEALDPREVREGKPPEDLDAAIEWFNSGAQLILDAVDQVGADARVWTFNGGKPAGWWIRRRVHEQIVHRADAELALGGGFALSPEMAADGVSEWIDLAVQARRPDTPLQRGLTLHLHATEQELGPTGEWTITNDEDGLNWSHDHMKGEAAVRGTATNLLLAITRRVSSTDADLEVIGDAAVWDGWLSHTPF
jgi:uncharacterized protein (TIGR03083 family)